MQSLIVKRNRKGFSVYAARTYKKGETICVLKGIKKIPRTLHYHGNDFRHASINPLQIGPSLYLDLKKPFLYFNHSCEPNAGIKGRATLFALRHIKKGEEITFDYSTTIDESFECQCGSKNCRGAVGDFFGLPRKTQLYYYRRGALPSFILKKFKASLKPLSK